jgi:hypothetical protein
MGFLGLILNGWIYFHTVIWPRLIEMLVIPIQRKATLEILIPLLVSLLLIQIYFGRNKNEQIGWNTAYANSIVLLFVTVHLGSYVYGTYGDAIWDIHNSDVFYKGLIVLAMGLIAFCLILIDFFHSLHKRLSFLLSSSIFVTFISFISVVLVYSSIPFDRDTVFSAVFILIYAVLFFKIFRWFIPASPTAMRYLKRKKEEREEEMKVKIRKINKKIEEKKLEFVWSMEYFSKKLRRFFNKFKRKKD